MKSIIILFLTTIVFCSAYGQKRGFSKEDLLEFRFKEICLEGECYDEMDDPIFRNFIIQKLSSKENLEQQRALELLSALRDSSALSYMTPFLYVENEKFVRIVISKIGHMNSSESPLYLLQALDSLGLYNELETHFDLLNELFNYPHRNSIQPLLSFTCSNEVKWDQKWRDWITLVAREYGEVLEVYFKSKASRINLLKNEVLFNGKHRKWALKQIYRQADKQFWINFLRENSPKDSKKNLYFLETRYMLGDKDYTTTEQKYIDTIKKSTLIRHNYE